MFFSICNPSSKQCSSWRHVESNSYRRRKFNWLPKFKSRTKIVAFHFVLMTMRKVWIHRFSLQFMVNNRARLSSATCLIEEKFWIRTSYTPPKKLTMCQILPVAEWLGNYILYSSLCNQHHYWCSSLTTLPSWEL